MLWLIFISLVVLFVVRWWKIKRFISLSSKVKCGITSYPLIGHAHLFTGDGANRMHAFQRFGRDAIKNSGMSNIWLGGKYFVVSADPVDLEVILKSSLEKDDIMRFARNLIGNGIIFAPVSIWRPRRKILAPTFSPKNLNNFVEVFARQSNVMIEQIKSIAGKGVVSIWKYTNCFALDSVCETTLGVKLNAQENQETPFLKSFDECCKLIAARFVQPWLHSDTVYKLLPHYARFMKNKSVVCNVVDEAIKTKRRSKKNTTAGMKTFLEHLIDISGGDGGYSDQELHEETLVIVIAGTDTSAVGTSFTISMLAKYSHVQEKVFRELQEVFGDSDRPVTSTDLPRLQYLDAVVRETLRLYPPVPVVVREIEGDLQLPSGLNLIKGCGVMVHIWAVHRNPQYWGDDAEQFRPERFIEAPLRHPAAFLAFSHGPRNCLGYQYAMMSMKTVLATLLRQYRVYCADDNEMDGTFIDHIPIKVTFEVMMKDVDGFRVKLEKRTKS